jgi:hypothetical protein
MADAAELLKQSTKHRVKKIVLFVLANSAVLGDLAVAVFPMKIQVENVFHVPASGLSPE